MDIKPCCGIFPFQVEKKQQLLVCFSNSLHVCTYFAIGGRNTNGQTVQRIINKTPTSSCFKGSKIETLQLGLLYLNNTAHVLP